jgi:L-lactate dehydrogenase complex protein LldE
MTTVQLFVTCLVDTFHPQIGEAAVQILQRLGVTVAFPTGQTCCGQPQFNAGLRFKARAAAEHTLRVFEAAPGEVVSPSGSCVHMLRHNYQELFPDEPAWQARVRSLAARTFEFSEYLVDALGVSDLGARWDGLLAYHPSCHLARGLGIDHQPRRLLAAVDGAQLVELPEADSCCGFGGVFSAVHPELSAEMLARKLATLKASRAATLVTADTGCVLHLAGGLHRRGQPGRVIHLAEVLNQR